MRQFGFDQPIIGPPASHEKLHGMTIKGRVPDAGQRDWSLVHAPFIRMWNERANVTNTREFNEASWNAYIEWFTSNSLLVLQPIVKKVKPKPDQYPPHARAENFIVSKQLHSFPNQFFVHYAQHF